MPLHSTTRRLHARRHLQGADVPPTRPARATGELGADLPGCNGQRLTRMAVSSMAWAGESHHCQKYASLAPPTHPEADVDYTFAQIGVEDATVDYGGNCGNMSSAVGPFAVDEGLVKPPADGPTTVRIHNTNTRKLIVARFAIEGGRAAVRGPLAIDGVVRHRRTNPPGIPRFGGRAHRKAAADGQAGGCLSLPGGRGFVRASSMRPILVYSSMRRDLGLSGNEPPEDIATNRALMADLEALRRQASIRMGLAPDLEAAAASRSVPFIGFVAPPRSWRTQSGIAALRHRGGHCGAHAVEWPAPSGDPDHLGALCRGCLPHAWLRCRRCCAASEVWPAENRPCLGHCHRRGRTGYP